MTAEEPGGTGARFWPRLAGILVRPRRTWAEVEPEPAETAELYRRWIGPLAAAPALCGAAGTLLFGFNMAGVRVRPTAAATVLEAAAGYVLTLVGVYLLAMLISGLAPAFGGRRDRRQALKLVAYAAAAAWVAGVFQLYPSLGLPVGLLAMLYSLYTLYVGLPVMMRTPPERTLTFFAAILIAVLALAVARGLVSARAAELGGPLALA